VQPPLESTRLEAFYPLEELRAMEAAAAKEALARAARILDDAHVRYSVAMQVGAIAPTIADCADEQRCDEIVVVAPPSSVLHVLRHIARQSVLDRLVRIARVPVTAVR
jgi:nucleotide-binding universal stress UspA family protein